MPIKLGSKSISDVYLGEKKISKIYLGSKLVYESNRPYFEVINEDDSLNVMYYPNLAYPPSSPKVVSTKAGVLQKIYIDLLPNHKAFNLAYNPNLISFSCGSLDTSNLLDITNLFMNCSKLRTVDVTGFNTSKYTSLAQAFCGCESITSLDLSTWELYQGNTGTSLMYMFYGCSNLEYLDVSKWNIKVPAGGDATNPGIYCMFEGCNKLKHIKCPQSFKTFCLHYQNDMKLPSQMRHLGTGTWEIVD